MSWAEALKGRFRRPHSGRAPIWWFQVRQGEFVTEDRIGEEEKEEEWLWMLWNVLVAVSFIEKLKFSNPEISSFTLCLEDSQHP